jgi:hypothetical protein
VKKDFNASPGTSQHGGHVATDFAWTAATETSCGTADCHDSVTNTNVVTDIYSGGRFAAALTSGCKNCHDNDNGGSQTTILGGTDGDADARLASDAPLGPGKNLAAACTVCHGAASTANLTAIHHSTTLNKMTASTAENGYCVTCHLPDVNQPAGEKVAARGDIAMPANMPCNVCHLYFPGFANDGAGTYETNGTQVKIFGNAFDPNSNPGALPTMTERTTHAVSENTTTPISDYGACFACHGATAFVGSSGTSTSVTPFHGLGTPLATANTNDDDPTVGNGLGGNYDDIINMYAGVNVNWYPDAPMKSFAWHPGWGLLNWLALETGYGVKGNYSNGSGISPGIQPNDKSTWTPGNRACGSASGTFNIPWDSYASGVIGTPVVTPITMDKDYGWKGTVTTDIQVPLVPLALNNGNCPLYTTGTWYTGPTDGAKDNAGENAASTFYLIEDQFTTAETGATTGCVTGIEWHNGGGTVTVTTGTLSGSTYTVTNTFNTTDSTSITACNLPIAAGEYIGYWMETTGDTKFSANGDWTATDAGQPEIKRSDTTIADPDGSTPSISLETWTGIYQNTRATVTFDAYK